MARKAIVVCEAPDELESRLTRILDFFEIPWGGVSTADLWDPDPKATDQRYCVLSSMSVLGRALMDRPMTGRLSRLLEMAESIFVFGGDQSEASRGFLQMVTGCTTARVIEIPRQQIACSVSDKRKDVCGPLSGLHLSVRVRQPQCAMTSRAPGRRMDPLISTPEGDVFFTAHFRALAWYIALCPSLVDLSCPVERGYFDVADCFFSAAPLVMYLRHAFAEVMFTPAETGACLIVDDPVLRPHYGFLDFQRLAALSIQHQFACNIGFIPWNWRRSHSSVVELFKQYPGRLSLSIHGCDHGAGEFGVASVDAINALSKRANARMEGHRRLTGLAHEPLMVFPQGVFSSVSPTVLKHNAFIAAVNTNVLPIDQPSATDIGDTWRTAILKYGDFAIYTRRYPSHGLHNFAFDILLGKPCLLATHHADFRNEGRDLMDFVDRLNSLAASLNWRTLGEVIRRAYPRRLMTDAAIHIRMFGNEIIIENSTPARQKILVEKQEHAPEGIARVEIADREIGFAPGQGMLRFDLDVGAHAHVLVRVCFKDVYGKAQAKLPVGDGIRLVARRYLSECRDEAQARAPWLYGYAQLAKTLAASVSRATAAVSRT